MEHLGHLSIILSQSISFPCLSFLFDLFLLSILSLLLGSKQYGLILDFRRHRLYLLMKNLLILFEDTIDIEAVYLFKLICLCTTSPPSQLKGAKRALLEPLIIHLLFLLNPLLLFLSVCLVEPLRSECTSLITPRGYPHSRSSICISTRALLRQILLNRRHFLQALRVIFWRVAAFSLRLMRGY